MFCETRTKRIAEQWIGAHNPFCPVETIRLCSRLKTEELEPHDWPVFAYLADVQASVATYFDYNDHDLRHSSIGYKTLSVSSTTT